jgi:hypothetical protein
MADERHVEQGYACAEVVQLASEYLEGVMTAEQMTRFELHLNLCDGCSSFLEQVRMTIALASSLPVEQIPDDLQTKLLAAFRNWQRE